MFRVGNKFWSGLYLSYEAAPPVSDSDDAPADRAAGAAARDPRHAVLMNAWVLSDGQLSDPAYRAPDGPSAAAREGLAARVAGG